mmetsp:Transcript_21905/g.43739  ORF Transcript_21905/g.43739 Transcript_21905/m.43739 type:complete len:252 (-) Transcript_21905:428-1183(-)
MVDPSCFVVLCDEQCSSHHPVRPPQEAPEPPLQFPNVKNPLNEQTNTSHISQMRAAHRHPKSAGGLVPSHLCQPFQPVPPIGFPFRPPPDLHRRVQPPDFVLHLASLSRHLQVLLVDHHPVSIPDLPLNLPRRRERIVSIIISSQHGRFHERGGPSLLPTRPQLTVLPTSRVLLCLPKLAKSTTHTTPSSSTLKSPPLSPQNSAHTSPTFATPEHSMNTCSIEGLSCSDFSRLRVRSDFTVQQMQPLGSCR